MLWDQDINASRTFALCAHQALIQLANVELQLLVKMAASGLLPPARAPVPVNTTETSASIRAPVATSLPKTVQIGQTTVQIQITASTCQKTARQPATSNALYHQAAALLVDLQEVTSCTGYSSEHETTKLNVINNLSIKLYLLQTNKKHY